jgi:oligosaccharyltransferase complex subunit gamma
MISAESELLDIWSRSFLGPASESRAYTPRTLDSGFSLESFHKWVLKVAPRSFPIYVPFNPIPWIVTLTTITAVVTGLYFGGPYILPLIQSKVIWQGASLVAILIFTSGHMWNRIRGAPYQGPNGQYIAPGFSQQFVLETQVVGVICEL